MAFLLAASCKNIDCPRQKPILLHFPTLQGTPEHLPSNSIPFSSVKHIEKITMTPLAEAHGLGCCAHVEDAHWIEACLKFRQAVAEEFERLLCAGAAVMDFPEVDDGELDTIEQGSAAA